MLASQQHSQLMAILSDSNAKFEDLSRRFYSTFTKLEYFRVSWVIQHLLLHNMLTTPQRLVGLFILYEVYLHENVKTTPFYQSMLNFLSPLSYTPTHPSEKKLLTELVKSVPKIYKDTPNQYIAKLVDSAEPSTAMDLEPYKKAHVENMPSVPLLNSASVTPLLLDAPPPILTGKNMFLLDNDEVALNEYVPEIARSLPTSDDSYILDSALFITSENEAELLWDYRMEKNAINYKELCGKALNGTLSSDDLWKLVEALKVEPEVIFEWGLTPDKLPTLVQFCPDLALALLAALDSSSKKLEYYQALFNMGLTSELASFIGKLQETLEVPLIHYEAFVNNVIENCIRAGEKQEDAKKKAGQARMLMRVMLRQIAKDPGFLALLQQDTFDKLNTFCIEFSHMNEAIQLHRILKGKHSGGK